MTTSIAYEDVQQAASQIVQCASNVLTVGCPPSPPSDATCLFQAINAPLQQRTPALDLDFTRANAFPVDYETDVELEWSNPSKSSLLLTLLTLLSPCP